MAKVMLRAPVSLRPATYARACADCLEADWNQQQDELGNLAFEDKLDKLPFEGNLSLLTCFQRDL